MKKTFAALLIMLAVLCCTAAACTAEELTLPCSVSEFFSIQEINPETVVITAAEIDCEEGPIETAVTEEDRLWILDLAERGVITGQENGLSVTGGTTVYSFSDAAGNYLGSIELYKGLAVGRDGMYNMSLPPVED